MTVNKKDEARVFDTYRSRDKQEYLHQPEKSLRKVYMLETRQEVHGARGREEAQMKLKRKVEASPQNFF